jgi:hypothetical protein
MILNIEKCEEATAQSQFEPEMQSQMTILRLQIPTNKEVICEKNYKTDQFPDSTAANL